MRRVFVKLGDEERDVALYLAFIGAALGVSVLIMVTLLAVGRSPYLA